MLLKQFAVAPKSIAIAPGRVNLIGEHVDYNDGIVLPFAIDRHVVAAGSPSPTKRLRLFSTKFAEIVEIDLGRDLAPRHNCWSNYAVGVIAEFRGKGFSIPGLDIAFHSDVPVGAGLSSSAAMEVATATLLESILGVELDSKEKALLCQRSEHTFPGVPCGIMDQYSAVFGRKNHLLKIDCRSGEFELIAISNHEVAFLIVNSMAEHELVDGEYQSRKQQSASALQKLQAESFRETSLIELNESRNSLTEIEFKRARHVISEIDRTSVAIDAVQNGDWESVGKQMFASHSSLRDDYEVSCDELDFLVEAVSKIGIDGGVFGSKMTGGGFGGCTVSLVRKSDLEDVSRKVKTAFEEKFQLQPSVFTTFPAAGTRIVRAKS